MKTKKIRQHTDIAIDASLKAGEKIMEIYQGGQFETEYKKDSSPLTLADKAANRMINDILKSTGIPILSEENTEISYKIRKDWKAFWLVDPLDGTKEFIKKNGEFTVNIALIENNKPVAGIVYVPVSRILYAGIANSGSYKIEIQNDQKISMDILIEKGKKLPLTNQSTEFTVVASRSHMNKETEDYINLLKDQYKDIKILSAGSSVKICMIAEGKADIYPRFGPTMEWDTAAAHAVAVYAGCSFTQADGFSEIIYNKKNLLNPWFVAKNNRPI